MEYALLELFLFILTLSQPVVDSSYQAILDQSFDAPDDKLKQINDSQ